MRLEFEPFKEKNINSIPLRNNIGVIYQKCTIPKATDIIADGNIGLSYQSGENKLSVNIQANQANFIVSISDDSELLSVSNNGDVFMLSRERRYDPDYEPRCGGRPIPFEPASYRKPSLEEVNGYLKFFESINSLPEISHGQWTQGVPPAMLHTGKHVNYSD